MKSLILNGNNSLLNFRLVLFCMLRQRADRVSLPRNAFAAGKKISFAIVPQLLPESEGQTDLDANWVKTAACFPDVIAVPS
jgi:hypothetical protein